MFRDRVRSVRIARGYKQQQMADNLNIELRSYQRYESGHSEPPYATLITLADLLNIPIDFLLGRDDYLKSLGVSVDVPLNSPPRRPMSRKSR